MSGALGDFEALGDLACGEAAVSLKEHERGEEAIGFHVVLSPLLFRVFSETKVI
jgi:hypothetical protein